MQKPMTTGLTTCTQDEWADRMSNLRVYQTEEQFLGGYSVMYSRLANNLDRVRRDVDIVGEVHYLPNGEREYFTRPV